MKRGDIVICALAGDYGKPRPAVIVQSDLFNNTHASIVVCPITTFLIEANLFRITLEPSKLNNLSQTSQIMIDKLTAVKRERITQKVGKLTTAKLHEVDDALKLWLGL